jgi:hypothetical protein
VGFASVFTSAFSTLGFAATLVFATLVIPESYHGSPPTAGIPPTEQGAVCRGAP